MTSNLFTAIKLGQLTLENRLVRAATYEGMGDAQGIPTAQLKEMYQQLAQNDVGLIITGFNHFCQEGRAMQPLQCGIETDEKIKAWKEITETVHQYQAKIILQLAHTGRQTIRNATHSTIWAPSAIRCTYFRSKPKALTEEKIIEIINDFAQACFNAKSAGFDGVQIHCAHGYLIHQFFSPHTNRRKDRWGGTIENRARFAIEVIKKCREKCGDDFPIILKISAGDDRNLYLNDIVDIASLIEKTINIQAIEVSYGTMEFALNIIRGGIPLKIALEHNPLFNRFPQWIKNAAMKFYYPYYMKKIKPFQENYNLDSAMYFLNRLKTPLILTGGIRQKSEMEKMINRGFSALSLSRPFLAEPNFAQKLKENSDYRSRCTNCNLCTLYCDSLIPIRCFAFYKK